MKLLKHHLLLSFVILVDLWKDWFIWTHYDVFDNPIIFFPWIVWKIIPFVVLYTLKSDLLELSKMSNELYPIMD